VKIALVIEQMDAAKGGRETSTAQIASALASLGQDVTILCQAGTWPDDTVKLRVVGDGKVPGRFDAWGRLGRLRKFVHAVQREIRPGQYDIVHTMLPIPGANVYQPRSGTVPAQWSASMRRRKLAGKIYAAAGSPLNVCRHYQGYLERKMVADPNVLCLCVSQMVAGELGRYYRRRENVCVIYNAVDAPDPASPLRAEWRQKLRSQLGACDTTPVFLSVATNFVLKGTGETITAFAQWRRGNPGRDGYLVIVGGRRSAYRFQRQADKLGVADKVVFVPLTQDIFPWYAAADAVVLLSWYDPCSRVVLEAVRWHIPAITTAYNGAGEVLADGAGLVVDSPRNTTAVVAAMNGLADFSQRQTYVQACREIAPQLSTQRHALELLQAYRQVVSAT
jgi:UDP-glucose:(heptosyl)LPS alpha-1,3-glucosyltransferase